MHKIWGFQGYIINNKNINKILPFLYNINFEIDLQIYKTIKENKLVGLFINPNYINQNFFLFSTIRPTKTITKEIPNIKSNKPKPIKSIKSNKSNNPKPNIKSNKPKPNKSIKSNNPKSNKPKPNKPKPNKPKPNKPNKVKSIKSNNPTKVKSIRITL